ncbi:hypothetical protein CONPUDRAFT_155484 [Coniophora puteana RWD-64-598 SS2]|uniref:Transposase family Tnp2 protein n=1 Tax=Coniophora puteana (strain RWD-64-598) TaxID=741705 RepID=A0A5M3MN41_CONPW|nr:uncharacterized protein CONPUDRAFT_155484 [Coniophora puteana RWD-64-598 SS2]EIW80125.1 hypothetical protein CONPUDRAFT_155484 [Coniophora puteana RWD-64-598 SS2]
MESSSDDLRNRGLFWCNCEHTCQRLYPIVGGDLRHQQSRPQPLNSVNAGYDSACRITQRSLDYTWSFIPGGLYHTTTRTRTSSTPTGYSSTLTRHDPAGTSANTRCGLAPLASDNAEQLGRPSFTKVPMDTSDGEGMTDIRPFTPPTFSPPPTSPPCTSPRPPPSTMQPLSLQLSRDSEPRDHMAVQVPSTAARSRASHSTSTSGTRPKRTRRAARVRAAPIGYDSDDDIDALPAPRVAQPLADDGLGLYDDSDGGEDIHNNPLLHTQAVGENGEPVEDTTRPTNAMPPPPTLALDTPPRYDPPIDPRAVYLGAHTSWVARLFIFLVAFLNAKHHLPFRACNLLLHCCVPILRTLEVIETDDNDFPQTLNTVIRKLDLQDRFTVFPICAGCHRLFPTSTPVNAVCPACDKRLYKPVSNSIFRRITGQPAKPPPPVCAAPFQLPSHLFADFLAQPGNEAACELWKTRQPATDQLHDISDGRVWNEAKAPDDTPFFSRTGGDQGELRLGITISLDWFGRKSSVYGPSHSSGVLSICISNLPRSKRYRASNLLVSFMTPGPREPTGEELQHYMKLVVDDLLTLFTDGVVYITPDSPEGRRIRVVLLAVICDHPALCKVSGFADHAHDEAPCPKCKAKKTEMFTDRGLRNQFPPRTHDEHRHRMNEWRGIDNTKDRNQHFKDHGSRWSELARLPYFDLVRHSVIDPMHNLLLGIARDQWYYRWIKTSVIRASTKTLNRELGIIHKFLATFETPVWMGKLPNRVGETAGGSLTADEYKLATTTAWAIIIPVVWDAFVDEATRDQEAALAAFPAQHMEWQAKWEAWQGRQSTSSASTRTRKKGQESSDDPEPDEPTQPKVRMHPDESLNFLRLAASLKIFCGSSVELSLLPRATSLLQDYLILYRQIHGVEALKPNFHWATHLSDQILDYGPVYNFWAFLSERLNKIHSAAAHAENDIVRSVMQYMVSDEPEGAGTLRDAVVSDELASGTRVEPGSQVVISDPRKRPTLSDPALAYMRNYYNAAAQAAGLSLSFAVARQVNAVPDALTLDRFCTLYHYALLDGRRIIPTSEARRQSAASALVKVNLPSAVGIYGEVVSIFSHRQNNAPPSVVTSRLFAEIRWMRELDLSPVRDDPWSDFPELDVRCFELGVYHSLATFPPIIPFDSITCAIARGVIETTDPPMWITTPLDRHPKT